MRLFHFNFENIAGKRSGSEKKILKQILEDPFIFQPKSIKRGNIRSKNNKKDFYY